jgi:hypothetical protein
MQFSFVNASSPTHTQQRPPQRKPHASLQEDSRVTECIKVRPDPPNPNNPEPALAAPPKTELLDARISSFIATTSSFFGTPFSRRRKCMSDVRAAMSSYNIRVMGRSSGMLVRVLRVANGGGTGMLLRGRSRKLRLLLLRRGSVGECICWQLYRISLHV